MSDYRSCPELRKACKRWRYIRSGRNPWTKGYLEYWHQEVARMLHSGDFRRTELPVGYGLRLGDRTASDCQIEGGNAVAQPGEVAIVDSTSMDGHR